MVRVFLSLGSNVDCHNNIQSGLNALFKAFGTLQLSPVYESESVGFKGSHFLNLVVAIETRMSVSALSQSLKQIEDEHGRDRSGPKFGPRTLDIDIVLYGDYSGEIEGLILPRPEVYENAFVLDPLVDLDPSLIDPVSGERFSFIRQERSIEQALWRIDFSWKGQQVSFA